MRLSLSTLLAALLSAAAPMALAEAPPPMVPHFVEETTTAGIDSTYTGEWEYMVGGGVAVFDCDGDGFEDLLLAGGEAPARFYRNRTTHGGALSFAPEASGLELDRVTGAYPLDADSDGHADVVLLRQGENVIMKGLGDCRFEAANKAWGFAGGEQWSTALAATFERGATWPTIAIGNYLDRNEELSPWGSCTENLLHRPAAAGHGFAPPMALKPSHCALSMLFTDWNNSGTPALRVSNDREYYEGGEEQLWRLEPGVEPRLYTAEDGWRLLKVWGMGIAARDLDRDGYPEYFLTSMADNKLQSLAQNQGEVRPDYKDVAYARGVTAHRPYVGEDLRPSTGWHAQFEDVNNDGTDDLFIAKGNVSAMPDFAMKDPNNLLLQDGGGRFHEAGSTAGIASTATARGAALADFNLDGLLDLVVVNRGEKAQIWRNASTGAGHWIAFRLSQEGVNRDAIGAMVEVSCAGQVLTREITVGGGHASGQLGWIHAGLGAAEAAEIRVRWPHGGWSAPYRIEAGSFVIIERGSSLARRWNPG